MQWIFDFSQTVLEQITAVLRDPIDPQSRVFWLYLLSSLVAAFLVYLAARSNESHSMHQDAEGSFLRFLFPQRVWSQKSAWLDLRYVFVQKVLFLSVFLTATLAGFLLGFQWVSGGRSIENVVSQEELTSVEDWGTGIVFMLILLISGDFIAWLIHYLQHKVPVLWQFHKVHHSAEVMHPISNFREHPVDNLFYNFFIGMGGGAATALAVRMFGIVPKVPSILGISALMFFFNFVAYNLRHSHVWLRWPGVWSAVFGSPAHHHVHHSRHPDHIDKNFAFIFPLWDAIFGTYLMPEDNRDVEFGITEGDDEGLDSILGLFLIPFRDAYRVLTGKRGITPTNTEPEKALEPVD